MLPVGAPVCSSYKDAIRIAAVVNMNNDIALHSMLERADCELIRVDVPLKRTAVKELQNGVGTVTNSGGTFYFPLGNAEVRLLGGQEIMQMAKGAASSLPPGPAVALQPGDSSAVVASHGSLPPYLSCSEEGFPASYEEGTIHYDFETHGKTKGMATRTSDGAIMSGIASVESEDRIFEVKTVVIPGGRVLREDSTFRLHPVKSVGNDRYEIDITLTGHDPTRLYCLVGG